MKSISSSCKHFDQSHSLLIKGTSFVNIFNPLALDNSTDKAPQNLTGSQEDRKSDSYWHSVFNSQETSCLPGLQGAAEWSITRLLELSIRAFQQCTLLNPPFPNSDIASGTHRTGASFISDSYFHISLCCLFSPKPLLQDTQLTLNC